jgi:hypothetical protein
MRTRTRAARRFSRRGLVFTLVSFVALAVGVPLAWAVGWENVGPPGVLLGPASGVSTGSPVYSSMMRLYQTEPVPSGAPDLTEQYNYPDGSLYMRTFVHWNSGTPVQWNVAGGNKYAICANQSTTENAERTITCQRYSTTSAAAPASGTSAANAQSASQQPSSPLLASLSVLKSGPQASASELSEVAPLFSELTDRTQSPAAMVDPSSIRRAGQGSYVAIRSDGIPCLSQHTTLECFTAFEPGGVATSLSDGRVQDSEVAPFEITINGIAVDGVSTVSFHLNDGVSVNASVSNNTFSATIPGHTVNDLSGYTVTGSNGAATSYSYPAGEFLAPNAQLTLIH